MLSKLRSHLAHNVVAYLALFVALGGTSYAAAKIGSKQIKNNSILSKDVKNKTLLGKDFKSGQLHAGPAGPTGATGARGVTGGRGLSGVAGSPAASFMGGRFEAGSNSGFFSPVGSSTLDGTSDNVAILSPARTVVARDLSVKELSRPAIAVRTYSLAVGDGTNTALSCVVSDAIGVTTCSDTGHAASIPAGSRLSLHYQGSGAQGGGIGTILFGWRATTP
jgi:hypothetical protein